MATSASDAQQVAALLRAIERHASIDSRIPRRYLFVNDHFFGIMRHETRQEVTTEKEV